MLGKVFMKYFFEYISLYKNPHEPINSIEHFIDIDSLIRNNNETGGKR